MKRIETVTPIRPRWSQEDLDILRANSTKPMKALLKLLPKRNRWSIRSKLLREHLLQTGTHPNRRATDRQIILRFINYKKPNGTEGGSIGRSTITLVDRLESRETGKEYWNDPKLWTKLRDWCLGKENVKFGKAMKTVTLNVLVTGDE